MIELDFYEVNLIDNEIKIHYHPKAKFKKQKIKSSVRDFLMKYSKIKDFKSDYEFQDHLNYIFKERILTSEEKLLELLKILEG
jgi:NAD+--asparagine ADP-ribosyltransferase